MKRSEINKALKELEAMCREYKCYLPPFCGFTPEQWQSIGHEYDEVRDCMLGWDITDYGEGDFEHKGLALITLRNGNELSLDFSVVENEGAKVLAVASLIGGVDMVDPTIKVINPVTSEESELPFVEVFKESELH